MIRVQINKFPKYSSKEKKNKKIGLSKQDIRQFFDPLQFKSFRLNIKNRFQCFVGFETENACKMALRKDGSILCKYICDV